jgi:CO/xanthine dehydrogenase Mo-binding subunit
MDIPEGSLCLTGQNVYELSNPGHAVALKQIAAAWQKSRGAMNFTGTLSLEDRFPHRDPRFQQLGHFVCGAAIAQVHLNLITGKIKVLKVVVAQDVGRALNPIDLEGQIEGAVVMEVGSALMEEHIPGQTLNFKNYPIPRSKDAPEIEAILVEVRGKDGPYGAKGAGEAVMGHSRAAILNAISDAAGIRITRLPVTPARLLEAIRMG